MKNETTQIAEERAGFGQQADIGKQAGNAQQSLKPAEKHAYARKKICLLAVVAMQISIMCGTAVPAAMTLNSGQVVTLKTKPVDPYDMFRGDYVRLRYDISDMKISPWPENGADVYVALYKKGAYWFPRIASPSKPKLSPGEVCIKGKYYLGEIHYGLEQVFVPEKTGRAAERAKSLSVDVAIDAAGNSVIQRVMNGDKTIYDAKKVIFGSL